MSDILWFNTFFLYHRRNDIGQVKNAIILHREMIFSVWSFEGCIIMCVELYREYMLIIDKLSFVARQQISNGGMVVGIVS